MRKPELEKIFEETFGAQVPYSTISVTMGSHSLDIDAFEKILTKKDSLYDPENCFHLDIGTVSLMDYLYEKYGEHAANLIEELI